MKHILFSLVLAAVFLAPSVGGVVDAALDPGTPSGSGTVDPGTPSNPGTLDPGTPSNSGSKQTVKLLNPLSSSADFDLVDFLKAVLDVILVFAVPIIVLFIMYSGFLFVTSRGEPGKIQTARAAFTWAVIGGVIILGAWAILGIIQGTINSLAS